MIGPGESAARTIGRLPHVVGRRVLRADDPHVGAEHPHGVTVSACGGINFTKDPLTNQLSTRTPQPPSPTPTSTLLTPTRTPTPTPPTNTHTITTNTPTPPTTPTSPPPPTPTPPPPPPSPGMSTRSAPDRGADQGADQSPIRDRPVTGWHPEPLATTAEQSAMNRMKDRGRQNMEGI